MKDKCNHVWEDDECWEFDGETEVAHKEHSCTKCGEQMTVEIVNEQLAELQALLREAAQKCDERDCSEAATWQYLNSWRYCERHKDMAIQESKNNGYYLPVTLANWHIYDLGVRIRVATEE